ncbi:hypothetical protein COP00_05115 [Bacillus glycinifermentans]|uniref:Uncharacterized protein n=1 Tax=Bacillus glycinifermentans TaxID=1664069 RepID=A0A0T6BPB8_9BACI|nr:hypothetical protein COP00_05115 [Bacillus glycinifermentans]KRT93030.1 hypothetical protein AB447_221130 [Bacillus glycinifermentans]
MKHDLVVKGDFFRLFYPHVNSRHPLLAESLGFRRIPEFRRFLQGFLAFEKQPAFLSSFTFSKKECRHFPFHTM